MSTSARAALGADSIFGVHCYACDATHVCTENWTSSGTHVSGLRQYEGSCRYWVNSSRSSQPRDQTMHHDRYWSHPDEVFRITILAHEHVYLPLAQSRIREVSAIQVTNIKCEDQHWCFPLTIKAINLNLFRSLICKTDNPGRNSWVQSTYTAWTI